MKAIIDEGTINAVKDAIAPLAEKVGQGAAHLYMVYVKQQFVMGVRELTEGILYLIPAIILTVILVKLVKWGLKEKGGSLFSDIDLLPGVFFGGCMIIMLLSFIYLAAGEHILNSIPLFINPEYYALQEIINAFKK